MKLQRIVNLAAMVVTFAVLSMADAGSMTPNSVIEAQSVCESGIAVPDPTNNPGLVSDCEALLAARDTLAGTKTLDWSDNTPIEEWDGITLSGTPLRVTTLRFLGLGSLFRKVNGEIPPELGNLSALEELNLLGNGLVGQIPPELGSLSALEELHLGGNRLTGEIPPELGNLSNLQRLILYVNLLTGGLPSELGNLTSLVSLQVYDNQLTGEIPASFVDLNNLEIFVFQSNAGLCVQNDAAIQAWGQNLSGFEGSDCSASDFQGDRTVLRTLYNRTGGARWHRNDNWLSNRPMKEWHGVTTDVEGRVKGLYLSFRGLTGQIPSELGNLSNLKRLYLADNDLTGQIPSELGNLSNLRGLSVFNNELTGQIPSELGSLSNVEWLSLASNSLTGQIPSELGNLSNLRGLSVFNNELTGQIPSELGNLSKLESLYLSGNQFTGCIPHRLQDVERNDFDELGLPFCEVLSPGNPSASIGIADGYLVRINSPISMTATFSAPVTGFTLGDITVSNGEASNFAGGDGDSVYTFDVTPDAIGDVTVDIAADVAEDGDSDGNVAAIQLSLGIPYDDDHDGAINRAEVITAIGDYLFGGLLTRGQVIELIGLYLFG